MVTENFLTNLKGKFVHIDHTETNSSGFKEDTWNEGVLVEFYEEEDEDGGVPFVIELENETDYTKILEKSIKKIYLKEKKKEE